MEYGDLTSLVVEYPDYNSMGEKLVKLADYEYRAQNNVPFKILDSYPLPYSSFGDLAGRSLIVTHNDGDLLAYGIIVNETGSGQAQTKIIPTNPGEVRGIAMCENLLSTVPYRAFFDLKQSPDGTVTFRGMLRTT